MGARAFVSSVNLTNLISLVIFRYLLQTVLSSYIITVIFREMNKRVHKRNRTAFNEPRIYHRTCRPRVTSFHSQLDRVSKRRTVGVGIVHCRIDYFGPRTDSILTNGYTMRLFRLLSWLFTARPLNIVRRQLAVNKRRVLCHGRPDEMRSDECFSRRR